VKGLKLIIRTDNGPQFVSDLFEEACLEYGVDHERIPPKTPNMNAHIESFHAQIERERLSKYDLDSYHEAYRLISDYIDFYNHRRMHGSLFDLSPVEFQKSVADGTVVGKTIKL
jgi:putative transposase